MWWEKVNSRCSNFFLTENQRKENSRTQYTVRVLLSSIHWLLFIHVWSVVLMKNYIFCAAQPVHMPADKEQAHTRATRSPVVWAGPVTDNILHLLLFGHSWPQQLNKLKKSRCLISLVFVNSSSSWTFQYCPSSEKQKYYCKSSCI